VSTSCKCSLSCVAFESMHCVVVSFLHLDSLLRLVWCRVYARTHSLPLLTNLSSSIDKSPNTNRQI
jgi:hypothetical protein